LTNAKKSSEDKLKQVKIKEKSALQAEDILLKNKLYKYLDEEKDYFSGYLQH